MKRHSAQLLAAGIVRNMIGEAPFIVNPTVKYLSVWPAITTAEAMKDTHFGNRASHVIIRPSADLHISFDAVANTVGVHSAELVADVEYVLPIHPSVNTISMVDAASASNEALIRWIVP